MKCPKDNFETENKRSFSNHMRWHLGLMHRESYLGINKEEKNGMWKGDNVGHGASFHRWVECRKKRPSVCEKCKERPPYDLTNKSGSYKRNLDDWEWLCRKCHMENDGRLNKLHRIAKFLKHSQSTKDKISEHLKGLKRSKQTKNKMKQAQINRRLREKENINALPLLQML